MSIAGFPSRESASGFLPQAWAGLMNLMVQQSSAFSGSFSLASVVYPTNGKVEPMPELVFDGIADGDLPVVYPSKQRIGFVGVNAPRVTVSTPAGKALDSIVRGFTSATAARSFVDERLRVAVELYSAALFEASPAAMLLTLSIAVEVLSPVTPKHPAALALIERWRAELVNARAQLASDAESVASLEALERELLFRRETSIRARVRDFIRSELHDHPQVDVIAASVVKAYDARSTLLHDGTLEASRRGQAIEAFKAALKAVFGRRLELTAA